MIIEILFYYLSFVNGISSNSTLCMVEMGTCFGMDHVLASKDGRMSILRFELPQTFNRNV
jgi:hypothetical protein